MHEVLLVIHLLIAIAIVVLVLLQRSEGGALGIGGGGGGGGLMTGRAAGNLLTRTTAILAGLFMLTSMGLTILAGRSGDRSFLDRVEQGGPTAPPAGTLPALPAAPTTPKVPDSD